MRGIVLVVLGIAAVAAYSVGRQNVPTTGAPVSVTATRTTPAKSVALSNPMAQGPSPVATSRPIDASTPSAKVDAPDKSVRQDNKRKVEAAHHGNPHQGKPRPILCNWASLCLPRRSHAQRSPLRWKQCALPSRWSDTALLSERRDGGDDRSIQAEAGISLKTSR